MRIEIDTNKFSRLSPRRRYFLIGLALIVFTTLLDLLPGLLPTSLGIMAVVGLVLGMLLCVTMIINKIVSDLSD